MPATKIQIGQKFHEWEVIGNPDAYRVTCQCSCGTVRDVIRHRLINGQSKSCGHKKKFLMGETYGEWEIIGYIDASKVLCRCSCGTVREVWKTHLKRGLSVSCGHTEFTKGQRFEHLEIIGASDDSKKVICRCDCGRVLEVFKSNLTTGNSTSCGCMQKAKSAETMISRYGDPSPSRVKNPRKPWQIEAASSRENMLKLLSSIGTPVTTAQIRDKLDLQESAVLVLIHKYSLEEYISFGTGSYEELEIENFIKSIYKGRILLGNREIISPLELDIYIPELKLAIEFNGDYWHCELHHDRLYHQKKNKRAYEIGVHLVQIFGYEWKDKEKQSKIKSYLESLLGGRGIYARDCEVCNISDSEAFAFCECNHLQGGLHSSINIGLKCSGTLVGVMTFGKPRFDDSAEYELLRLCYKEGIRVTGGSEKMFKHFLEAYKPKSIISYCDWSKFSGKVYTKLGFKLESVTNPNYVWYEEATTKVLPRYKTMKHRLIEKGYGKFGETEVEIMQNLGWLRIFDCGNLKFIWKNAD